MTPRKKVLVSLAALSVMVLVLTSLIMPTTAQERWRDVESRVERVLDNPEATSSEKAAAVRSVARFDNGDGAEFLLEIFERDDDEQILAQVAAERRDLEEERAGIDARVRQRGNRITQDEQSRLAQIDQELARLDDRARAPAVMRNAAVEALAQMRSSEARTVLREGIGDNDGRIRLGCVKAARMGQMADMFETIAAEVWEGRRPDDNAKVRAESLQYFFDVDKMRGVPYYVQGLADESNMVKFTAIRCAERCPTGDVVGPLIEVLAEAEGRMRSEIAQALRRLTSRYFGDNYEQWRAWWNANRDRFVPPSEEQLNAPDNRNEPDADDDEATGVFYGQEVRTNAPIFIIDRSGSMQAAADLEVWQRQAREWANDPANAGQPIPPIPPPPGEPSKWEVCKQELMNAVNGIPEDGCFNVVFYSTDVQIWFERGAMCDASDRNKQRLEQYLSTLEADGLTNIHDALRRSFELVSGAPEGAGGGIWTDGGEEGIMAADTFFFMTDGYPTTGATTDVNEIINRVREWNGPYQVVINTVCVGQGHEEFLQAIAQLTGGQYTRADGDD